MRIWLVLVAGIIFAFVLAHLNFGAAAQAQSPEGQYQITSGSAGGPFGYLLNVQTGVVKFCGGATGGTVCTENLHPNVVVMKSAKDRV
jgi:hypothetical protein